jgi:hypothetical protein
MEAADLFQMAADKDKADGENCLGIYLELGLGIEKDTTIHIVLSQGSVASASGGNE